MRNGLRTAASLAAFIASMVLVPAAPALAQEPDEEAAGERTRWNTQEARGTTRAIDFTTDEGTWMSVDPAPDGDWIAFDLLGHVYRIRASGGEAEALTANSGVAVNYHPRYSPDGTTIAFITDREGQDNLWLMDADGSNPRAVFSDVNVRAYTPTWTPDGEYIVVRRQSVGGGGGGGSGGGGSGLWMYHRDGGQGVQLVEGGAAHSPSVSPDGRHLFYHVRDGGRDALSGHYQLRRLDLRTGDVLDLTSGTADGAAAGRSSSGGAYAPEISPDGRWLAFGRQIPDGTISFKGHEYGPRTALWLRDLRTGAERVVMDPISLAIESGSKSIRILPGYGWSSDGRSIVLSQGGKIRRLDVGTGAVETVPFTARVQRTISEMAYQPFRITDEPFEARFMRWHTASPDGRRLAVQAVGKIWVSDVPAGTGTGGRSVDAGAPARLTPESFRDFEYAPAWSPDGRWIAFTTRDDVGAGHLWKVPSTGGAPQRLTTVPGEYVHPAWSHDGSELVVALGSGASDRGRTISQNPWWDLVTVPADGGEARVVTQVALPSGMSPSSLARRSILQPSWGPEGRIFFPEFRRGETALVSIRPDGLDRRTHLIFSAADEIVPSPDGRWVAFQEGDNVYLMAFPWTGTGADPIEVNKQRGRFPVTQLSLDGGLFPRWRDAGTVEFGSATRHFTWRTAEKTADTVRVALSVPRPIPDGSVALTGARIVTLDGDEVIENGTVVVQGSRITCVGTCSTAEADEVIDARGKTIIPGFVDMHAHHYREHRGFRPRVDYEAAIYLAYGVTTNLDNSMWSQNIFPTAELIDAGEMVGPRTYSSGDPLYRGDAARQNELRNYAVTEQNIERLRSWGAVSLKQYMQPRRDQRQWVSHIAREKGLMVSAEGGDLLYNLGMIMDGQTAWEHPLSEAPVYGDVAKFFGRAGAYYVPTFVVAGPGPSNIDYYFAQSDLWLDEKQRRFMPWRMLMGHLRRRTLRPDTDYSFPLIAQGMADIITEGGFGAIGSHGEHHGPSPHWEIWMAASAMGAHGALEVASLHGAKMLGAEEDLGSLEVGKLADLIVLNSNPLDDIHNTIDIRFVMKGGVLHDADTLEEIWPQPREFGPLYWIDEDALRIDVRPVDFWDTTPPRGGNR